jgi:hypothetical protein
MTLRRDQKYPPRQPPKRKWVIPLWIGIAVAAIVFAVIVVIVSGQSFF